VALRSLFERPRSNSFLCRWHQAASYHFYTVFFTQEAATQLATEAQAQYHQTKEDGILEHDVQ